MSYTKTTWVNDQAPAINATNLNKIETGIFNNDNNIAETLRILGLNTDTWDSSSSYDEGDLVVYANKIYKNITGDYTITNPTEDTTNWMEVIIIDNDSVKIDSSLLPIKNAYSALDNAIYSCDYINKNIVYSSSEQDTGTKWINGKTIYRKCFTGTGTSTGGDGSTEEISTGITNIEDIVRLYGTYSDSNGIITEQLGGYLNNLDNASFLYFNGSSAKIMFSRGGSWKYGKYNIVIEYTKTS